MGSNPTRRRTIVPLKETSPNSFSLESPYSQVVQCRLCCPSLLVACVRWNPKPQVASGRAGRREEGWRRGRCKAIPLPRAVVEPLPSRMPTLPLCSSPRERLQWPALAAGSWNHSDIDAHIKTFLGPEKIYIHRRHLGASPSYTPTLLSAPRGEAQLVLGDLVG